MPTTDAKPPAGPWNEAVLSKLLEWDPTWTAIYTKMATDPWTHGVLPRRFIELVGIALNVACTNLNAEATRRHIRAALTAGATRDQILMVIKMASVLAIHSCSLGAPMLLEEAAATGKKPAAKPKIPTPACDKMRAMGQWNTAWDPFVALDPQWTDESMAAGAAIYASGVLPPKEVELLSIAFDASYTHMYAPGTRRHIKGALAAGATGEEIMEVLKLCVAEGAEACNLGVPILEDELRLRALEH